jgi:hypothetical protein
MKQYQKGDLEYRSNGHYLVEGIEFMSVWTYKNSRGLANNLTSINGREAIELSSFCSKLISTKPDFGGFDNIYAYQVNELDTFYNR